MSAKKATWKVFWDLQCPYSKKHWQNHKAIVDKLGDHYDFEIHLTSLAFHPQAFPAQCAANLILSKKGDEAKRIFIDACFEHQDTYMNAALPDARPSDVTAAFCKIAKEAGLLDTDDFTEAFFASHINDWTLAVQPAYTEHKVALGYGVYGTPKHVIDEVLVPDTESSWGPEDWAKKISEL